MKVTKEQFVEKLQQKCIMEHKSIIANLKDMLEDVILVDRQKLQHRLKDTLSYDDCYPETTQWFKHGQQQVIEELLEG